jgi:hypothetical protein
MLELQNFLKIVLRKISGTFVFEKIMSTPPVANIFLKNFLGGPGMQGGPNFGIHAPNRKPVGTALRVLVCCTAPAKLLKNETWK